MNAIKKVTIGCGVLVAILALEGTGWSQCAMCRTALANSPEGQAVAQGFNQGIIFLLAAPYAIIGSVAVGVIRAFWKKGDGESAS